MQGKPMDDCRDYQHGTVTYHFSGTAQDPAEQRHVQTISEEVEKSIAKLCEALDYSVHDSGEQIELARSGLSITVHTVMIDLCAAVYGPSDDRNVQAARRLMRSLVIDEIDDFTGQYMNSVANRPPALERPYYAPADRFEPMRPAFSVAGSGQSLTSFFKRQMLGRSYRFRTWIRDR